MKSIGTSFFLTIILSGCLALLILLLVQDLPREHRAALASVPPTAAVEPLFFPLSLESAAVGRPTSGLALAAVPVSLPLGKEFLTEIQGKLQAGETLATALARLGLAASIRHQIVNGFRTELDFRRLRPGDEISVLLRADGGLAGCTYCRGPLESYTLVESGLGWQAAREQVHLTCRTTRVSGTVGPGSLADAFIAAGERAKLASAFADIFASKIDFNTETAEGDRFSLLVEKYYRGGRFVGYGKILVGCYDPAAAGTPLEAIYFESGEMSGHFSLEGKSLGASFIRSPVPLAKVSSGFTDSRKHPVLGIVRPHLGVDLAAPAGTPVMAAADGRVRFIGVNGGFGKQIVLDHPGGYRTHYGHLSRYRRGLRTGARVRQRDIIGYVGATGLATGPHLDYRLEHLGEFKNPFTMKFRSDKELVGEDLARLRLNAEIYETFMDAPTEPEVLAVRELTLTAESSFPLL